MSQAGACCEITGFVDKSEKDEDYWLDVLRHGKWRRMWDGKPESLQSGDSLRLKNLDLYVTSVTVNSSAAMVAVDKIVACDRSEEHEEIINECKYPDGDKAKSDFPFMATEDNLTDFLDIYDRRKYGSTVYSVSTLGGSDIPTCNICHGRGHLTCETCGGQGSIVCEACHGLGEIEYNAGNYANGEPRIKSKACPNCGGTGRLTCPDCHGEGTRVCRRCDGSGKVATGSCVQRVKSFDDIYYTNTNLRLLINTANSGNNGYGGNAGNNIDSVFGTDNVLGYIAPEWFAPLWISKMYTHPGKLTKDNSEAIRTEAAADGNMDAYLKEALEWLEEDVEQAGGSQSTVCLLENYFQTSPIVEIIVGQEGDYDMTFYVWEDIIWCDQIWEVNKWDVLFRRIKSKLL